MQEQSRHIPPIECYESGLPIYFLTGKNYLYQTLFCIKSLVKVSSEKFNFILVDDGSFDSEFIIGIRQHLRNCKILQKEEIQQNLNSVIPETEYPYLHKKRKEYPHIKKLTDVHTSSKHEWKVVIDSDMLFWNEPKEFINWLKKPSNPIFMLDCEESYGYSKSLMKELCKSEIYDFLNVGIIGLNSTKINWNNLENWSKTMEEKEGTSYYLEQALSAMLVGNQPSTVLPKTEYIVNPTKDQVLNHTGCLHHYVDLSKEHYYTFAWKKLIGNE